MSHITRGGGGVRTHFPKWHRGEGGPKSVKKVSRIIWMAPKSLLTQLVDHMGPLFLKFQQLKKINGLYYLLSFML
jgi:hypothetical protein